MVSTLNLFASDKPGLSKTESARVTESGCTGASFTGFLPAGKRTRTYSKTDSSEPDSDWSVFSVTWR